MAGILTDVFVTQYDVIIDAALGASDAVSSPEYQDAALAASRLVNIALEQEGAVLLKNQDDTLPIAKKSKVNVYGVISAGFYLNGSGSSASNARSISLKKALEADTVGLTVNPTLWSLLEQKSPDSGNAATVGSEFGVTQEIALSDYEAAQSFADAKAYSEYAIVTIGRNGGEEADPTRAADEDGKSMLELNEGEIALLKQLHDTGFKVITLINSSWVMELGPAIEYSDAILWIGGPGEYGIEGVADVLVGNVNPSGRLVDTWMYAQETASSYYPSWSVNNTYDLAGSKTEAHYTNYNEGIYVGYKWYETADKEGYWDGYTDENAPGLTGYDSVVAYPFGYGLSYTTFDEKLSGSFDASKNVFTFTVTVTNTGSTAGKDVVQLYVEKPYTDGGIEVPEVELIAFTKTGSIAPGKSETVTLTVEADDLTSYSAEANNGQGSYVLIGGSYNFYLASGTTGAHVWKTADSRRTYTCQFGEKVYTDGRSSDKTPAVNQLAVTDNDYGISSANAESGFKELSRAGGFANAKETISKEAFGSYTGTVTLTAGNAIYDQLVKNFDAVNLQHLEQIAEEGIDAALEAEQTLTLEQISYYKEDGTPYVTVKTNGERVVLGKLSYDDPRWNTLLSQMSLKELNALLGKASYGIQKTESLGMTAKNQNYDGPLGLTNFMKSTLGVEQAATSFASEPVMASTWNRDLMVELGEKIATECNAAGVSGIYGPGLNIHRTPFGGRNAEYFSEDALLSGLMAASEIQGMSSKGIYTYAKHFAFNEIETYRLNKMNIWIGEQAARETYLKAFELAVKEGGSLGIMSSFMLINGQWTGGNYNLITGILRNEWGFQGAVVTDTFSANMSADKSLTGGSNLLLSASTQKVSKDISGTDVGIRAMKTAAKQVLYMIASVAPYAEVEIQDVSTTNREVLFIAGNILFYGGAVIFAILFFLKRKTYIKKNGKLR